MASRVVGTMIALLFAGAASLSLSGVAHADQTELVDGECAATVLDGRGEPLAVDADELLGDVGVPAVRLGSNTERIAEDEAVHLPVGDLVEALGVQEAPMVGDVAEAACDTVDGTARAANGLASTTGTLAAGANPSEPSPVEPVDPVEPQPPLDEVPADGGGSVTAPPADVVTPAFGDPSFFGAGFDTLPLPPLPRLEALPNAAGQGPDLRAGGPVDRLAATNTGHAQALSAPVEPTPARAPFVLAVGLLAAVAAVMVRRWITRSVN